MILRHPTPEENKQQADNLTDTTDRRRLEVLLFCCSLQKEHQSQKGSVEIENDQRYHFTEVCSVIFGNH